MDDVFGRHNALLSLVPALAKDLPGRLDDEDLRAVLREYAFLPDKRRGELRPEHKAALGWLDAATRAQTRLPRISDSAARPPPPPG
jgi:hypothetical protein